MKHSKFEQQFLNYCRKQLGLTTETSILLAVSGGVDSMVMLHLFHRLHFNIAVAHCNFNLRGNASQEDEKLCERICKILEVPFYHQAFDTKKNAEENGVSIQMAARQLRYAWFDELTEKNKFDFVSTAHHSNDQAETILMNLISGKGVASLRGIPSQNKKTVRPLLSFSKEEILTYATENNIEWREDESNASSDYQRNYIRHHVIPNLKELNPSIQENLVRLGNRIEEMNFLVDEYSKSILEPCIQRHRDFVEINFSSFLQHPSKNYLIWLALKEFGFEGNCIDDIIASLHESGKTFYSNEYILRMDRMSFLLEKSNSDHSFEAMIPSSVQKINLPGGELLFQPTSDVEFSATAAEANTAFIDASLLHFPLEVRTWKIGDSFYPLGMNQKKKLSDYFIDKKMSINQKNKKLLLMNGEDIVWILGDRLDHRYRITTTTTSVLKMKWEVYE
ncbi:MAG: tRNA lysidine(34) synthetase TilS [Bacteroidia bacterium]